MIEYLSLLGREQGEYYRDDFKNADGESRYFGRRRDLKVAMLVIGLNVRTQTLG